MEYRAKYRRPGPIGKWIVFKNVTGDGFIEGQLIRFFVLADGAMIHFPSNYEVVFSAERDLMIREKLSKEAGQQVKI